MVLAEQSEGLAGGDILNVVKLAASQAVARDSDSCKVLQTDILNSIDQVRTGKQRIGSTISHSKPISVKETIVKPEELPPDAKKRYDEATSDGSLTNNRASTSSTYPEKLSDFIPYQG